MAPAPAFPIRDEIVTRHFCKYFDTIEHLCFSFVTSTVYS